MDVTELKELETHLVRAAKAVSKLAAEKQKAEMEGVTGVASTLLLTPGTPVRLENGKEGVYLGTEAQLTGRADNPSYLIMSCPEWTWGTFTDRRDKVHPDWYSFSKDSRITVPRR